MAFFVLLILSYVSATNKKSQSEIEKLFQHSYYYREIEAFKTLRKQYKAVPSITDDEREESNKTVEAEHENEAEEEEDNTGAEEASNKAKERRAVVSICRQS